MMLLLPGSGHLPGGTAIAQTAENAKAGDLRVLELENGSEVRLRWVPPGTFTMGSPEDEEGRRYDETPHKVTLTRGFWMGETEVTQALYASIMGNNPSNRKGKDLPVEQVFWDDVQLFLKKINAMVKEPETFLLPTEAQWEYASRAGAQTAFSFGDDISQLHLYANFCDKGCKYEWKNRNQEDAFVETAPVASFKPNAWGLYDMHGNVWEWCADRYGPYPTTHVTDPSTQGNETRRVARGGCWFSRAIFCRSARRVGYIPAYRVGGLGFRLILQEDVAR